MYIITPVYYVQRTIELCFPGVEMLMNCREKERCCTPNGSTYTWQLKVACKDDGCWDGRGGVKLVSIDPVFSLSPTSCNRTNRISLSLALLIVELWARPSLSNQFPCFSLLLFTLSLPLPLLRGIIVVIARPPLFGFSLYTHSFLSHPTLPIEKIVRTS